VQKFNINNNVKIKLTEAGIDILKKERPNLLEIYNNRIDKDGYTQVQLWEVMNVFGKHCYNGNNNLPFETNIIIPGEYTDDQIDKIFNINDYVDIKLTEAGINVLKEQHEEMVNFYSNQPGVQKMFGNFKAPKVDENGYTQEQFWVVMNKFGQCLYNGNQSLPFEPTIAISKEYLEEQKTPKKAK